MNKTDLDPVKSNISPADAEKDHKIAEAVGGLSRREILFGLLLASASGLAIIAHTFGPVRMSFAVPFIVLPATAILVGIILLRKGLFLRLHVFSNCLIMGGLWGFIATLLYDAVRPLLKIIFGFAYSPFAAMSIFGNLITGLPQTDPIAITVGWIYHFWNGISFGMMFALLRPRGGLAAGFVWAMVLQGLMMAVYPSFLQARLQDPGFLAMGLVGHGIWGIALGEGLRRKAGRYA